MRLYGELDKASFHRLLALYEHPEPQRCEKKVQVFQLCRYAQKAMDFKKAGKVKESRQEWDKMRQIISVLPLVA